jgi:hypothetical protein
MTTDEKLWSILIDSTRDETGLAGVPLEVVERRVIELAAAQGIDVDKSQIEALIQRSLDEWIIDKTVDELSDKKMKEIGIPVDSCFIWHLKVLTAEKTEFYKSLKPEAKALIRLLREQNDTRNMGIMPRRIAAQKLEEQGFTNDLEHIYVRDTIEDFITSWGDDLDVWCYGLVREFEKTEEYKKWHQEVMDKAAEKEARRYRMNTECEITGPIHGHLEDLAEKRWEDLEELEMNRNKMGKQEYLHKKAVIESRDEEEETQWNAIIEAVYGLEFNELFDIQAIFLSKELPSVDEVRVLLDRVKKKDG